MFFSPSDAFYPDGFAADGVGWDDVFGVAVAYDDYVGCWECVGVFAAGLTKGIDAKLEDFGVGLPHAYYGTLYDVAEVGEAEVLEDGLDVAVEVADEDEGVVLGETGDDGAAGLAGAEDVVVAVVGYGVALCLAFFFARGPGASADYIFGLYLALDEEEVEECVVGAYVGMFG